MEKGLLWDDRQRMYWRSYRVCLANTLVEAPLFERLYGDALHVGADRLHPARRRPLQ